MGLSATLDRQHARVKANRWFRYFTVFCRIVLAAGFIPSGLQKVMGERFTVLPVIHPMGHYLDALYQTGFYYTSIGVMQVTAAILLLIPRTATLGAIIYFPIILNILILTLAVRFEGSLLTSPLMVLACLYLLCWDYNKWKFVLPFKRAAAPVAIPTIEGPKDKFPTLFFAGVFAAILSVVLLNTVVYRIKPRNTYAECVAQCAGNTKPQACHELCDCVYKTGRPFDQCLREYDRTANTEGTAE